MPISLGFWEWGCPKRGDAHTTVAAPIKTTRRKLDPVNFRKDFWDSYWARAIQLLANLSVLSQVTVPEVLAKVNSDEFPSRF